jgi:hypothetical protein
LFLFSVAPAAPWPGLQKPQTSKAADLGARCHARHHPLYVDRLLYPPCYLHYYERPCYYAPLPFVPFNFGYGICRGVVSAFR